MLPSSCQFSLRSLFLTIGIVALLCGIYARFNYLTQQEELWRSREQQFRTKAFVASVVATGDDTLDCNQAYKSILEALHYSKLEDIGNNRATWKIIDSEIERSVREAKPMPSTTLRDGNKQAMLDKAEVLHQEADRCSSIKRAYHSAKYYPLRVVTP